MWRRAAKSWRAGALWRKQRLEHLTELFETGRWRRYHSEVALLENIQEAKRAVETWRDLLQREASLDNSAIDMSWLGRRSPTASERLLEPVRPQPKAIEVPRERPAAAVAPVAAVSARKFRWQKRLPPSQKKRRRSRPRCRRCSISRRCRVRYPLLRNTL